MLTRTGFTVDGVTYSHWRCTSDGLIAVQNDTLAVWEYYRLDWRSETYRYVGSTVDFHDPNKEASDKQCVFPV